MGEHIDIINRVLLLSAILLFFTTFCQSASIGVAPSVNYVGAVEKGETTEATVHLTTTAEEPFKIRPEFKNAISSTVFQDNAMIESEEVSEQDVSSWITPAKEEYEVNPSDTYMATLDNEDKVEAVKSVKFRLEVPYDAEPGYHALNLKLNPKFSERTETGTSNVGVGVAMFVFKVPGKAERDLEISGINAYRTGENEVRMDYRVENKGSVTTTFRGDKVELMGPYGKGIDNLSLGSYQIKPGEQKVITDYWRSDKVEGGDKGYQMKGSMDYMTGRMTVDKSFSLPESIEVAPPTEEETGEGQDKESFPLWLIMMVLVVLGALMYALELDPMMILGVLGLFGISMFILFSELSNLFILLPVIITVGVFLVI